MRFTGGISEKSRIILLLYLAIVTITSAFFSFIYNNFIPNDFILYIGFVPSILLTFYIWSKFKKQAYEVGSPTEKAYKKKPIRIFIGLYFLLPWIIFMFFWVTIVISIPMTINLLIGSNVSSMENGEVISTSKKHCNSQREINLETWTPFIFEYCISKNGSAVENGKRYNFKTLGIRSKLGYYVQEIQYNGVVL